MSDILERLDKIEGRLSEESFLSNKGLSNEVGIHIFCYDPADELIVREYFRKISKKSDKGFNLVECDLYSIFMDICEEKKIIDKIPAMEESKGSDVMKTKVCNVATPEYFVRKMLYEPHNYGDVLLISGVGKVYPYMRSHSILEAIQAYFSDIPVLLLYPGKFDGRSLSLFGKIDDGHYYRAFNLI